MTRLPLERLGPGWRSHRSALWWLALLYRDPARFREALEVLPRRRAAAAGGLLWLHALPWMLALGATGRAMLFGALGLEHAPGGPAGVALAHLRWIAEGVVDGAAAGLLVAVAFALAFGLAAGTAGGVAIAITVTLIAGTGGGVTGGPEAGVAAGILVGFAAGISVGTLFGLGRDTPTKRVVWAAVGVVFGLATTTFGGLAVGLAAAVAFGVVFGIAHDTVRGIAVAAGAGISGHILLGTAGAIALGISTLVFWSRAYYHLAHPLFLLPRVRGDRYRWHPVAWDRLCAIPFPDLDRLLAAYAERAPEAGKREIARLIATCPGQRWEALRARTILLAREAADAPDLARLDEIVGDLPEGRRGFLAETRRLREMVHEIASLQAQLDAIDRPFLREPMARLLIKEIEGFQHRVSGFHEPLVREFRTAAERWLRKAQNQLDEVGAMMEKKSVSQIFRAGDPVDRSGEAFVPRDSVIGELERQILLTGGCPGLVLYGRRRIGKSTILRNLPGFLPSTVRHVQLSMQAPWAFTSLASLIAHLGGKIHQALHDWPLDLETPESLEDLFRFLSGIDEELKARQRRLVLALDEYENIDRKIGEGVFPEDLLATFRESIQSHRGITWIFAGSHEITRLENAPWTSYLVSTRTVEVPPFTAAETRLLLTEPLKYSLLWLRDDPARPRFAAEFWGDGGIERIHDEAGGWPHLVQLIAEAVVDALNDEGRSSADAELIERAFDTAVVRGHTVLYELMQRESHLPGEWEYLAAFKNLEEAPPPDDEALAHSLRYRLLVREEDGMWRLRVPLMKRWLRQRG